MNTEAPARRLSRLLGLAGLIAALGVPGLVSASETIVCNALPLIATTPEAHAQLGWSLSVDGEWLAAGANQDNGNAGSVALYRNPHPDARPDQNLRPSDLQAGDQFGSSVSLSGEWLAAGAPGKTGGSGAVYLFQRIGLSWVQKAELNASAAAGGAHFGASVALSGKTLVVGASGDSGSGTSSGAAYVFELKGGDWKQTAKLLANDGRPFDLFGSSVAIAGDESSLVVGAPFADDLTALKNFGAAYVFNRTGGGWTLADKGKLTAGPFRAGNIQFGAAVAMGGGRIVVGAPGDDNQGLTDSGSAYVFERNGSDWSSHRLVPEDSGQTAQFGTAVRIDEKNRVLIGSPFDGTGTRRDGAAYLFEQSNGTWKQSFKIRHTPGGAFGQSVWSVGDQIFMGGFQYTVGDKTDAGAVATCPLGPLPPCAGSIAKTDQRDTVQPGDTVTYQIDVVAARPGSTVSDDFPSGLEAAGWCRGKGCTNFVQQPLADPLPAGGDATYLVRGQVGAGASGTLTNKACVKGSVCQEACASDTDQIQTTTGPILRVTKTDGLTQVAPGDPVTYTITVKNIGDAAAAGVAVTDTFSSKLKNVSWCPPDGPGCANPIQGNINQTISLSPGGKAVFTATGTVAQDACGTLTNQACSQLPNGPTTCGDDPPDRIAQKVDLALTDPSAACGTVGYTVVITNPGPTASSAVQVTTGTGNGLTPLAPQPQPLAGVSCSIVSTNIICTLPSVAAGATVKIPVSFTVPDCTAVNPILVAAALGANCDPSHDQRSISVPVVCQANLEVEKTGPSSVAPGDPLPYSLKVTNLGPDPACGVSLKDPFPPGLGSPSAPNCTVTANEVQCLKDKLSPGDSSTFGVTFTVPQTAVCGSKIVNTVTATALSANPQSEKVTTTVTCCSPSPGVSIHCSGVNAAFEGDFVTFTYVLSNGGPNAQADNPGNEFTDTLPAGLTLVGASASSGTVTTALNTVSWNGAIPVCGTVTITVQATVDAGTAGMTLCSTGNVSFDANGDGSNESSASDSCCLTVSPTPPPPPIPTLSGAGLATLALLLAGVALLRLRRRDL